jgi:hypothetical protein
VVPRIFTAFSVKKPRLRPWIQAAARDAVDLPMANLPGTVLPIQCDPSMYCPFVVHRLRLGFV